MTDHGMDSYYRELEDFEWEAFEAAKNDILDEARKHAHKRPKMTTLLEEFSELVLSFRGKHDDPPSIELKQVASVALNILWQYYIDKDITNNIVTIRKEE